MALKKQGLEHDVKLDAEIWVCYGVKVVLKEEMARQQQAGSREFAPTRQGERHGHRTRNLLIPAGEKVWRLEGSSQPRRRVRHGTLRALSTHNGRRGGGDPREVAVGVSEDLYAQDSQRHRRLEPGEGW